MARRHEHQQSVFVERGLSPVMTIASTGTQSFLDPLHRVSFYSARITIPHHQLRHRITTPNGKHIYYVDGKTLQRLDIETRQYGLIAILPAGFETTSCLASSEEYLILGAEDSARFLSINVADIWQLRNPRVLDEQSEPQFSPPPFDLIEFGTQHQSSCSLVHLSLHTSSAHTVVAVIANNDCSLGIYCITHRGNIVLLNLPFPIEHATFSPDGKYIILVGDSERASVIKNMAATQTTLNPAECHGQWQILRELVLYKHPAAVTDAYLTTAWSDDGRFVAVASESGYITLIDATALEILDADPIIITVPSSKPNLLGLGGLVRSMTFLPSPWDLLLWVEDSGTAYLGDLRDGLATRQVLDLEWKAVDAETDELNSSIASDVDFVYLSLRRPPSEDAVESDMPSWDGHIAPRQRQAFTVDNPAMLGLADAIAAAMNVGENRNNPAGLMLGTDVLALPPWEIAHPIAPPDYEDPEHPFQQYFAGLGAADDFHPPGPVQPQLETDSVPLITTPREDPHVALPPDPRRAIPDPRNPLPGPPGPPARSDIFVVGSLPVTTPHNAQGNSM